VVAAATLLSVVLTAASPPAQRLSLRAVVVPEPSFTTTPAASPLSPSWSNPPPCIRDVCQPRVAIPGREPQLSLGGRRTELFLSMVDRTRIEPLARVARWLAVTGLRLDYSPSGGSGAPDDRGWGRAELGVRWRIDALNRPVWAGRGGG
jgi:hypothetical protein